MTGYGARIFTGYISITSFILSAAGIVYLLFRQPAVPFYSLVVVAIVGLFFLLGIYSQNAARIINMLSRQVSPVDNKATSIRLLPNTDRDHERPPTTRAPIATDKPHLRLKTTPRTKNYEPFLSQLIMEQRIRTDDSFPMLVKTSDPEEMRKPRIPWNNMPATRASIASDVDEKFARAMNVLNENVSGLRVLTLSKDIAQVFPAHMIMVDNMKATLLRFRIANNNGS